MLTYFSVFQNFLSDSRGSRGIRREDPNKWLPVVDVAEDETDITIQAELPGMKKEDVHLDISNGILTLSGEKKKEKREDNTHFHRFLISFIIIYYSSGFYFLLFLSSFFFFPSSFLPTSFLLLF